MIFSFLSIKHLVHQAQHNKTIIKKKCKLPETQPLQNKEKALNMAKNRRI